MEQLEMTGNNETIAAISTPPGSGGVAVIRISGPCAIATVDEAWRGKPLSQAASHTVHLGKYMASDGNMLDEAVATVFRAPRSFTGEDVVELSVHGSRWIQREVLSDLIRRGVRTAHPGEFTQRAFLNGRLDLAQAEGIADLIASSSKAAHRLALSQTRGHFSSELESLRSQLVEFASLLELELDFSEEDVEFADRTKLSELAERILRKVDRLAASYSSGAAIKDGVPVVIAGIPNAGKSSLLNLLLGDDKAIVSDIPGTTRDTIEDTLEIDGVLYRFIDTAGLRATSDIVENLGIDRARTKMREAYIVVWLIDPTSPLPPQIEEIETFKLSGSDAKLITLLNKSDLNNCMTTPGMEHDSPAASDGMTTPGLEHDSPAAPDGMTTPGLEQLTDEDSAIPFSTKTGLGLDVLKRRLNELTYGDINPATELIVTNARHYEALTHGAESLRRAIEAIRNGISADFIAQDVREVLHYLGTITGAVTTDTLLHSIFSRFCVGK